MVLQRPGYQLAIVPLTVLLIVLAVLPAAALSPQNILLIANRAVPHSIELARYYQQKRLVPETHLLTVTMPAEEHCSRQEYQQQLLAPLRQRLARPGAEKIHCLVLFYGLPLKILAEQPATADSTAEARQAGGLAVSSAAVDSEIVLARVKDYPLAGWVANPLLEKRGGQGAAEAILLVSRLDAATPDIVRRMIDDSLATERSGLRGKAYFDARWPASDGQGAYQRYDTALHQAARTPATISRLEVVLEETEALLVAAPQAAIYSGWYSLGAYTDIFTWQPGAVGYHIASGECATLKQTASQGWCKRMLDSGAAATLGPVAEPYVQAFPRPDLFFGYLLDGYYSLVESYFYSLPYLSWQMILLGDPLYRPFRH